MIRRARVATVCAATVYAATFYAAAWAVLLGGGLAPSPAIAAPEDGITGRWDRDDGLGGIKIARCGQALCGRVVWLKDRNGPGRIGERVFYDMRQAADGSWTGKAHNPEDGHDYAGTMMVSGNRLTTSGCVLGGLVCKSLGLSRAH